MEAYKGRHPQMAWLRYAARRRETRSCGGKGHEAVINGARFQLELGSHRNAS